ncbi:aliphatic sulfonate ABC transporter substrate-binding protein [Rhodococcus sp. GOMB7]|uniref:taurine ABC transporter substrate-binding protein n=1 Tax=Rhodococcus sp. GOMB7 TaxID=2839033 RepID=UPI0004A911D3|nr:aliphatic sulfonate ABC transporter substrate-binding protein [Rhodococcus sp. GOMB7]KDQ03353.1 glycine/betaine ABC transporter substrate-binding protein [Rhodococcus qingshengii]MBT9298017.1 aliphatic sulfonate ABC transporter substrate-binding protein [Rhodococcus sp. GOMB7]
MTDNQKHASSNLKRSSNSTPNEGRAARTAFTVLIGVLALVLGACSVDHSGQDSSKETIRIAYQSFPSGDLIVKNNRWLEDALPEYNVKWTKFDSGADINTAFIAGEIDFGAIGSSPVARGLSAPLNIPYQVAFVLDVAGDNEALVARNATGIKTVADLRGKKVATAFASTAHYSLLAALNQAGLSADDVQLVDLQPQASLAAWQRGDIDAVYTWLPTLDELRKDGTQLIASRELATAGRPTLDLGVVSTAFAKNHPEIVDTWRQVQARALTTIATDPNAAAEAVAAQLGASKEDAAAQLKQGVFLTPEQISSPEWLGTEGAPGNLAVNLQSAAQFLAEQKQIDSVPDLAVFQNALYVKGLPDVLDQ